MKPLHVVAIAVLAACGPETTSFRPTDANDPARPAAARVTVANDVRVDVWSNGGYIGASDEPMTHVGFEVQNASASAIVFDTSQLELTVFDKRSAALPLARFVAVTPLGPAQIAIGPGETKTFDAYFLLPVRPRVVDAMRVRWQIRIDDRHVRQTSTFVRDDDYPVTDPPTTTRT